MTDKPEHHNIFIDALVELVGQEKADQAIALGDRARAHTAALLRAAAEATDPGPDQRVELQAAKDENEALAQKLQEAEDALVRRGNEINLLNDSIESLKGEIAKRDETIRAYVEKAAAVVEATPPAPLVVEATEAPAAPAAPEQPAS